MDVIGDGEACRTVLATECGCRRHVGPPAPRSNSAGSGTFVEDDVGLTAGIRDAPDTFIVLPHQRLWSVGRSRNTGEIVHVLGRRRACFAAQSTGLAHRSLSTGQHAVKPQQTSEVIAWPERVRRRERAGADTTQSVIAARQTVPCCDRIVGQRSMPACVPHLRRSVAAFTSGSADWTSNSILI
jgi:hypothetical protein